MAQPRGDAHAAIEPMEARSADALPTGAVWQFEPKWDGFRCLALRNGDSVALHAKSGKPLDRFFPEIVELVRALPAPSVVLDGELVIETGGALDFDALQARLHPAASRIRKLAHDTPARLVAFDMLVDPSGRPIATEPLSTRRAALARFIDKAAISADRLALSPATTDRALAERWLAEGAPGTDGVVAKRLDAAYAPGERAMVKVKRLRTADCVVGGFRYGTGTREVGSLLLGLYNDRGLLDHVGFTSAIARNERAALTRRLEALRGAPGFTGDAPGGPSRWSTERSTQWEPLRPELVVEVSFDHWSGGRFRHGTRLLRFRPDKAPRQCTVEQVA